MAGSGTFAKGKGFPRGGGGQNMKIQSILTQSLSGQTYYKLQGQMMPCSITLLAHLSQRPVLSRSNGPKSLLCNDQYSHTLTPPLGVVCPAESICCLPPVTLLRCQITTTLSNRRPHAPRHNEYTYSVMIELFFCARKTAP